MARHKLEIEQEEDLLIIAICCHEKDYRLCWKLNKACSLELERAEPTDLNPEISSVYCFYAEDDMTNFTLIANRNNDGWLMPEYRQVDYFLTLSDPQQRPVKDFISKIKGIDIVLAVYQVDEVDNKLRDKLMIA